MTVCSFRLLELPKWVILIKAMGFLSLMSVCCILVYIDFHIDKGDGDDPVVVLSKGLFNKQFYSFFKRY